MANNLQKAAIVTGGIIVAGLVVTAGLVIAVAGAVLAPVIGLFGRKAIRRDEPQQHAPTDAIDVPFERLDK